MLSIMCPHCQAQLNVAARQRGTTIKCLGCGQQLAVSARENAPAKPADLAAVVVDAGPRSTPRRRQKAIGNRVINTLLHLSITVATICIGFYLITLRQRNIDPDPVAVVEAPQPPKTTTPKTSPPRQPKRATSPALPSGFELPTTPTIEAPKPLIAPFEDQPTTVDLPTSADLKTVPLMEDLLATDRVEFVSATTALTHPGKQLLWTADGDLGPTAVAELAVVDGNLVFRWLEPVPRAAEAAVRNSVVRIKRGEFQHVFALRHPQTVDPLEIDLNQPLQRIVGKFAFLPAAGDVCFELSGIDELPAASLEGVDPSRLQLRDQTTLTYADAQGAATRLTVKKRGNLVAVELESRYRLPSGAPQTMTIERGNRRLRELAVLHQEAQEAAGRLSELRSQLKTLQNEARNVPRSRATVTAKSVRLGELQNSILATQRQIQYAEQLLQQKEAIAADHQAIQQVAKLAQQLHETKLRYRFYTVVDGHEVDLLVAQ